MANNKDAVVNFRVTVKMKQDILKTCYEHNLTLTDLFLQAYIYYKDYLANERGKDD